MLQIPITQRNSINVNTKVKNKIDVYLKSNKTIFITVVKIGRMYVILI